MEKEIKKIIEESITVKRKLLNKDTLASILEIVNIVEATFRKGGKLILFGNGGSAADSQHIAAEFVGRFQSERKALPAIALTTNTSTISAIANDYGYEHVFSRQLSALAKRYDVVIGISTSGNARNVIEGIRVAKKLNLVTIGLTGSNGGNLAKIAELSLIVPSSITARIQEAHITIGHIICQLVEKKINDS